MNFESVAGWLTWALIVRSETLDNWWLHAPLCSLLVCVFFLVCYSCFYFVFVERPAFGYRVVDWRGMLRPISVFYRGLRSHETIGFLALALFPFVFRSEMKGKNFLGGNLLHGCYS